MTDLHSTLRAIYRLEAQALLDHCRWWNRERYLGAVPWPEIEEAHALLTRLLARKPKRRAA